MDLSRDNINLSRDNINLSRDNIDLSRDELLNYRAINSDDNLWFVMALQGHRMI